MSDKGPPIRRREVYHIAPRDSTLNDAYNVFYTLYEDDKRSAGEFMFPVKATDALDALVRFKEQALAFGVVIIGGVRYGKTQRTEGSDYHGASDT